MGIKPPPDSPKVRAQFALESQWTLMDWGGRKFPPYLILAVRETASTQAVQAKCRLGLRCPDSIDRQDGGVKTV